MKENLITLLSEIKETIINHIDSLDNTALAKKKKYKNYIKNNMNPKGTKNVAIAYYKITDPDNNGQHLFALSNLNGRLEKIDDNIHEQINHEDLIKEIKNVHSVETVLHKPIYYKIKRLNGDLEFEEVPENDIDGQKFIKQKEFCCERKILEHIKLEYVNNRISNYDEEYTEAEKAELQGELFLYTRFLEPCLYCYSLLKEIQENNPKFKIKVYYEVHREYELSNFIDGKEYVLRNHIKSRIIQKYLKLDKKTQKLRDEELIKQVIEGAANYEELLNSIYKKYERSWYESAAALFDGSLLDVMPPELEEPIKLIDSIVDIDNLVLELANIPNTSKLDIINWLEEVLRKTVR
ncbi:hypothetical protein KHA93_06575 [Bacillus sp. FJAT-49732]|uniref:Uncharacterized protein n=1 Tax=Lederbergia citrisecunda TaxID=2833583 RepID=A0A942TMA6_9BACI|nr:hypothetical protein [Lederbergia citrisecunda]MBS4199317.1 hypothetical protein [Lederbergia citrisecunda]